MTLSESAAAAAPARSPHPGGSTEIATLSAIIARRSLERARSCKDETSDLAEKDRAIEQVLGAVADLFGAHRAGVMETSEDGTSMRVAYEWTQSGLEPYRDRLGELSVDTFPWLRDRLAADEPVMVSDVSQLPHRAAKTKAEFTERETASFVSLPIALGPRASGVVTFEWAQPGGWLVLDGPALDMVQGLLTSEMQVRHTAAALQRTNRVLRAMIECSEALLGADDEEALLEDVCRIVVEVGDHRLAWVGFGHRDKDKSVRPVAKWGHDAGYLDEFQVTWADIELGRGPVSKAVRTGQPSAVQSVATEPDFEPWRQAALDRGYESVLAVSLGHGDELLGALGVYAARAWAFDAVEVAMMQRFADYLAYGIVALRNRRHRAEAEEQLRQTIRSKDELIASISHELRTPLTAVVGFAQILREGNDLPREDRETMIRSIVDEGLDLSNIVEDLLTVARAEAGTLTVVDVPVDLRAQASQVCETLREADASRVSLSGSASPAHADPGRVRQILRNLVSNALRYGGDRVEIRILDPDGTPRIQVVDDGPGVPIEDRERIFESYQKAHDVQGVTGSVGLGLAISRTLARLMGGDLSYDHAGGNSVFELTFGRR